MCTEEEKVSKYFSREKINSPQEDKKNFFVELKTTNNKKKPDVKKKSEK